MLCVCMYEGVSNKEAFKQYLAGQVKNYFPIRCAIKNNLQKFPLGYILVGTLMW